MAYRVLDPARTSAEAGMATIDRTARFIKRIVGEEGKAKIGICCFEYAAGSGKIRILVTEDKTPILKASRPEQSRDSFDWKVDVGLNPSELRMKLVGWEQEAAKDIFKKARGLKVT